MLRGLLNGWERKYFHFGVGLVPFVQIERQYGALERTDSRSGMRGPQHSQLEPHYPFRTPQALGSVPLETDLMSFSNQRVFNCSYCPMWLIRWLSGKESTCQCRRYRFDPWFGKTPQRRKWQPSPVFLLGKSHGQRGLAGYSPWGSQRVRDDLETK